MSITCRLWPHDTGSRQTRRSYTISSLNQAKVFITVCTTCLDTNISGDAGVGAGEILFRKLSDQQKAHPDKDVMVSRGLRCLMACSEGCAISIASRGKMKYLLGRLSADDETAEQLLDFAAIYARAPFGVSPNHEWPPLVGQHFLGRIPPDDIGNEDWDEFGADL